MEKGLEITFTVNQVDGEEIVEALANLVGNEFLSQMKIDWRVFHITMGEDRYYKVCFIGPRMSKLHPLAEEKVRKRFDELSHLDRGHLLKKYRDARAKGDFKQIKVKRKIGEYDLWQDNFWQYF